MERGIELRLPVRVGIGGEQPEDLHVRVRVEVRALESVSVRGVSVLRAGQCVELSESEMESLQEALRGGEG